MEPWVGRCPRDPGALHLSPLCKHRPWQAVSTGELPRHLGSVTSPQQDAGPCFCIRLPAGCADIVTRLRDPHGLCLRLLTPHLAPSTLHTFRLLSKRVSLPPAAARQSSRQPGCWAVTGLPLLCLFKGCSVRPARSLCLKS